MTATEQAVALTSAAAKAADDKQAKRIIAIDVSERLIITDVFLICVGGNRPQLKAIQDAVEKALLEGGASRLRREEDGGWILLDYGDVVVHIQQEEEAEFYALERLWGDCPQLDVL